MTGPATPPSRQVGQEPSAYPPVDDVVPSSQPDGWTCCAREGCRFVAFAGFDYCPDHCAEDGAS